MGRLKLGNRFNQPFSNSAGEINHDADVFPIHEGEHLVGGGEIFHFLPQAHALTVLGYRGQVRMDVNHRIARPRHFRFRHMQHAARFKILEQ